MFNDTFILGSGKTMLDISNEEKDYINKSSLCVSLNKYLLFYEKIGIIPKFHYQLDGFDAIGRYVFKSTLDKIESDPLLKDVIIVCGESLEDLIKERNIPYKLTNIHPASGQEWNKGEGYDLEAWFKRIGWSSDPWKDLFHFKGSLTSVINLVHAMEPTNKIKLLGVDMSTSEYFFQKEYVKDGRLHDWTYNIMSACNKHSNILEGVGGYSQEKCIPKIRGRIISTGGDLVVCNKKVFYFTENFLNFEPIIKD